MKQSTIENVGSPHNVSRRSSENYAFLQTSIDEVSCLEQFLPLNATVEPVLRAPSLGALFDHVIERTESKCGLAATREVLTLLWVSSAGLSQRDLEQITDLTGDVIARVVDDVGNHLVWRNEPVLSLNDHLSDAVARRYLIGDKKFQEQIQDRLAMFHDAVATGASVVDEPQAYEAPDGDVRTRRANRVRATTA